MDGCLVLQLQLTVTLFYSSILITLVKKLILFYVVISNYQYN